MKILKRLTNKAVLVKPKKFTPENEGEEVLLYRVSGKAKGFEIKESNFGESYALLGSFTGEGIHPNIQGEIYVADTCFLAGELSSAIVGNLKPSIDEESGEIVPPEPIDFSFVVSMRAEEASVTGYTYHYDAQIDLQIQNPLTDFLSDLPALPDPKTSKAWDRLKESGEHYEGYDADSAIDSAIDSPKKKKAVKKKGRKKK